MTAVIRFHTMEPLFLTTQEYEQLRREVTAAALVDPTLGTQILAKMVLENEYRYNEIMYQRIVNKVEIDDSLVEHQKMVREAHARDVAPCKCYCLVCGSDLESDSNQPE